MRNSQRPSVYDQLRPHLDAADLIVRLGLQEARRIGSEAYCKPLCHESTSQESLQINIHTGRWNCKACQHAGVRGDLIQLVEYVLTGGRPPSHGETQGASESHRQAVLWLCQQYGIAFDEHRIQRDVALDVVHLFAMLAHEYLLVNVDVLEWIRERWGFDRATVEAYGIGYMSAPILPSIAEEARRASSHDAFKSSGLGWYSADGSWHTRFEGRVLFPYLEHGKAVYLIGRATPWTPKLDSGAAPPKYHKLSVHSETRPYISEKITNDHLYNETVMNGAPVVVVAEGVADAVALSSLGVPVVSPVTISFNATDLERFTRKAGESQVQRVEILFDNELSGSGNWAARRVGLQLVQRGLVCKILTLPLGPAQQVARDEVVRTLGDEVFAKLEESDPRERKELIAAAIPEEAERAWIQQQIEASKIDAAEWSAELGAEAITAFAKIRREGRDVVELEIESVDVPDADDEEPYLRAQMFDEVVDLAAHVDDALARNGYASKIAAAAGKGVTKTEIAARIADARKLISKHRKHTEKTADTKAKSAKGAVALPPIAPEVPHVQPKAPPPPSLAPAAPGAPPAPPPPGKKTQSDHDRYAPARDAVAKGVEGKLPVETLGEYVSQVITISMGYTPFRTPDELYLVRGNERVPTGLDRTTARFESLLFLASGLTSKKSAHRAYIAAVVYFLEKGARKADDVSWSYIDPDGVVYFPTGDEIGRILRIAPGSVARTRMAEVRVPAVAGTDFVPIEYMDEHGGIQAALDAFRWTSISHSDRLVLVYWIACLPILRRVGTVPIVRIEGGSSSGKTRTVEAVSYLVNGKKGASVPTDAALVSRMATEMLTVDDNRETVDVSSAFLGTLLQATHLGAREKRRMNSDTGTVIERVCGALLMSGVEPIHDGRPELASRMLILRCDPKLRIPESPASDRALREAILRHRNHFWSEAVRSCAAALQLDETHGERIGEEIEEIFGASKVGRLGVYLRLMYLAWAAGLPVEQQAEALIEIADPWRDAYESIGQGVLESLVKEELAVSAVRYAFAWGAAQAKGDTLSGRTAFEGGYVENGTETYLGPMRVTRLARIVREAAKALNAPEQIAYRLRAGQLEQRILDGLGLFQASGIDCDVETTRTGVRRFTFRQLRSSPPANGVPVNGADPWGPA